MWYLWLRPNDCFLSTLEVSFLHVHSMWTPHFDFTVTKVKRMPNSSATLLVKHRSSRDWSCTYWPWFYWMDMEQSETSLFCVCVNLVFFVVIFMPESSSRSPQVGVLKSESKLFTEALSLVNPTLQLTRRLVGLVWLSGIFWNVPEQILGWRPTNRQTDLVKLLAGA